MSPAHRNCGDPRYSLIIKLRGSEKRHACRVLTTAGSAFLLKFSVRVTTSEAFVVEYEVAAVCDQPIEESANDLPNTFDHDIAKLFGILVCVRSLDVNSSMCKNIPYAWYVRA